MSGNDVEIRISGQNNSGAAVASARKDVQGLTTDVGKAGAAMGTATKSAGQLGQVAKNTASVTAGILSADLIREGARVVVEQIKSVIDAASNLNESTNAVQKIFHENSGAIEDWGNKNAAAYGLSKRAFNEYSTPLGAALKNQGLSLDQVTDYTIRLTKRASDMASVFNTDVGEALEAIQAGLRGESDPLEKFGVGLSAAKVQARALADTGKANAAALTQQELSLARLNILFDQTNDTEGDFVSTSTGLANATRIANAEIEDAKSNIGAAFLPVLGAAATATGNFAKAMGDMPGGVSIGITAVLALGTAFVIVAPKIKSAKEALDSMTESDNKVARGAGRTIQVLGKVTAVLAAVQIAGRAVSSMLYDDLNPNIEATAKGLDDWDGKAKLAGEAARVFGENAEDLDGALAYSSAHGFAAALNKFDEVSSGLIGMDGWVDESNDKVKAFDATLTKLLAGGQGFQAFQALQEASQRTGISVDDLKKILPQYTAAVELAGKATYSVASAAQQAAADVDDLGKAFKDTLDDAFALGEAQDKLTSDTAQLGEKVKANKEAHEKGATALTGNTEAALANRDAIRGLIEDTARVAEENQKAGKSNDNLKKSLEDQLRAMGFSQDEISAYTNKLDELIRQLNAIPPVITTDVYITEHSTKLNLGYTHGQATGGVGGGQFPYAASGGLPRQGGTPTMMNEQGAELVNLPWGATVWSGSQSRSMMERGDMLDGRGPGGGGSGGPLVIRGDGTPIAELLIQILSVAVAQRGGRPDVLGLKLSNN